MRLLINMIFLLTLMLLSALAVGAAPHLINYQGRILDASGNPPPNGNFEIVFSIYDASVGGEVKWTETQINMPVTDGFFSAVLGSTIPLSDTVFNGAERFLEITIGDKTITPRIQFTSTGYAYRVSTVDGSTGGELFGSLTFSPSEFVEPGNALTVLNQNNSPVFDVSVNADGNSSVSFYEPADAKNAKAANLAPALDISVSPDGTASLSFFDPVDSKKDFLATAGKAIEISVNSEGLGTINFYEPTDSKNNFAESSPKVQMHKDGLIMFGATELDTSLIVAPNGDIIGLGQITMGQNSSSGVHTSVLGFDNDASGDSSSIGGGSYNVAFGTISVIGGGHSNSVNGTGSTIGGGAFNQIDGDYATIGGGTNNIAMGNFATIPGGQDNDANGDNSYAAGYRAAAEHSGSFVWADNTESDFATTAPDQFIIRANGGVGIGTNSPEGILDVTGTPGDNSVNFPDDAIASPEILDEPGLTANRGTTGITLQQGSVIVQDLITTTITIPAAGYIMLSGGGTLESTGTNKVNQAYMQIDEIPDGGLESPYYSLAGSGDHDTPSAFHYFSMSVQRIYYKEAGTYEFRLEGQAHPLNGSNAVAKILNPYLTAVYFPTSYGAVSVSTPSFQNREN